MPKTKDDKDLTREQKVDRVYLLICRGLDRSSILEYARDPDQAWKDKDAAIDEFISEAETKLADEAANIDPQAEAGKAIARLNHLYQEAIKCQDHKTALSIQKEINKLLALSLGTKAASTPASQPAAKNNRIRLVK